MKRVIRRKSSQFSINSKNRLVYKNDRVVIETEAEKERVLEEVHSSATGGHVGQRKAVAMITERYYWDSVVEDVQTHVSFCERCQKVNPKMKAEQPALHPVPVPGKSFKQWGMDLIGPLTTTVRGNKYIVAATDYFSKHCEAKAIPRKDAVSVGKFLLKIYRRYGAADVVITDQGREFVNEIANNIHQSFGAIHRITSAYHPQANGLQERGNQTLQNWLRKVCDEEQCADWDEKLKDVLAAARFSPQSSSGKSPYFILYGREATLPVQLELTESPKEADLEYSEQIASAMGDIRRQIEAKVSANICKAQSKMKDDYAKKHGRNVVPFVVGEEVLLENSADKCRKAQKFSKAPYFGPYVIDLITNHGTYALKNSKGEVLKQKVAHKRLKRFRRNPSKHPAQKSLDSSADDADSADEDRPAIPKRAKGQTDPGIGNPTFSQDSQSEADATDECLPFPLRWGGGADYKLINTCPIDNFLAILQNAMTEPSSRFLSFLEDSERIADQHLYGCLMELSLGRIGPAKDAWIDFLLSKKHGVVSNSSSGGPFVDLDGMQADMFLQHFRGAFGLLTRHNSVCSNKDCSNIMTTNTGSKEIIVTPIEGESLYSAVQGALDREAYGEPFERECTESLPDSFSEKIGKDVKTGLMIVDGVEVQIPICGGIRTVKPCGMSEGIWLLPVDVQMIPCASLFDIPDRLNVGEHCFELRGITVFRAHHFRAYLRKMGQNEWYQYCGMRLPQGSRVFFPQDGDVPQYAIYTL